MERAAVVGWLRERRWSRLAARACLEFLVMIRVLMLAEGRERKWILSC